MCQWRTVGNVLTAVTVFVRADFSLCKGEDVFLCNSVSITHHWVYGYSHKGLLLASQQDGPAGFAGQQRLRMCCGLRWLLLLL